MQPKGVQLTPAGEMLLGHAREIFRSLECMHSDLFPYAKGIKGRIRVLANTTALATSARFVPSIKDGKPNGFKLYALRPGSIFARLGMQNADLIKAINGLDMSTPDKALEAYAKLKSASHLTVMLERRNENITLDYQIR